MQQVKVYHFNEKGLAEGIRLLLAYGGQEFKDRRYTKEEYAPLKPMAKFRTLPVMKVKDKQYAQSVAVCRYLGKKYNLIGDNDEEAFEIDEIIDYINDIRTKALLVAHEMDDEKKKVKQEEYAKNVYPFMLEKLKEIVEKNDGHVAAGKLTWGDFWFAGIFDAVKVGLHMPDLDKQYPIFKKLVDNVYSIPKVKAFADVAPKTDM